MVVAVPALVYGVRGNIELHRAWWRTVTESTAPNLTNPDNVSIAAMYAKWIGAGATATALTAATIAVLLAAAAFVFLRRAALPFPEALEGALLLTYVPLLSPQGWDYVFLVSTPAIVFLANYEDRLPLLLASAHAWSRRDHRSQCVRPDGPGRVFRFHVVVGHQRLLSRGDCRALRAAGAGCRVKPDRRSS